MANPLLGNRRYPRMAVVWLLGGGWVLSALEASEDLREKLAGYASTPAVREEAARHVQALGSSDYRQRREAMAFLIGASGFQGLLREALSERAAGVDREAEVALRVILQAQAEAGTEEKIRLLLRRVCMEKARGLGDVILDVWEGRGPIGGESRRLSRAAMRRTLEAGDLESCRERLSSATPLVRELAVLGVQVLGSEEEQRRLLSPLLADPNDEVRFQVATILLQQGMRQPLPVLAALLQSDTFHIRHESHEVLVALTDQDFGYYSDALAGEREKAASLWRRWVAKFGDRAEVRFERARYWAEEDDMSVE